MQHRDQTPHSSPGHRSDSRSGEDPTGSGPGCGKQLETHTHTRENLLIFILYTHTHHLSTPVSCYVLPPPVPHRNASVDFTIVSDFPPKTKRSHRLKL